MSPLSTPVNPVTAPVTRNPGITLLAETGPVPADLAVLVGGLSVGYARVQQAADILQASSGLMVRQPLARAGNPLAWCDYHAAGVPFRAPFLDAAVSGCGAAGRHITKSAFQAALAAALEGARQDYASSRFSSDIEAALSAFSSDHCYAASIAFAAVTLRRKQHAVPLRSWLRQAAHQAQSECDVARGEFSCENPAPCGTGSCRFASGVLTQIQVPSARGRQPRGANHVPGGSFNSDDALPALEQLVPMLLGRPVTDADSAASTETHV